ncbi:hypothetical protein POX_e06644 [Penicillium oxalicum]|uniref:hypothetical protein n=1 Tax=Penicillium oxalicum TaxID=69781 RepID=UPI0020B8E9B4|nr:hypothetical protein POX_e06644 [Penicillium oxalicum]KAI2788623.1 hypothetical protein POX_e06644 [Penicillium oxalicum]
MQPNYARGYPQGSMKSPATARRGPGPAGAMPVPMPQHAVNPQYLAAQRTIPHPNDAALRRSRKPTDKNMPEGLEDVIIGEGVEQYKNLRDLEKRLDAAIVRKRLDIQDSISKTVKKYRTLRIWITNTVENQPWQGAGGNPGSGRFKVRIEGRLLDDDNDPTVPEDEDETSKGDEMDESKDTAEGAKQTKPRKPSQRLSHFFKTIAIDFDKSASNTASEAKPVTWTKPQASANPTTIPPNAEFDCIQFSRSSQENINVTISLVRDETPERYKLSKELAEVLDVEEETRSGIVLGIWDYIRAMGLQEDEEKRQVRCDHRLRSIFGRDQMFFPQIPESIGPHTSPMDPIKLPYTIRVDEEFHKSPTPTIYDIQVAALAHSRARHSFYKALAKDPATFLRRWINSQRRDLETIIGDANGVGDGSGPEFRRGGPESAWETPVAKEAVRYMLAKPEAAVPR